MRICDRCPTVGPRKATDQIEFKSTCEKYDLCASCMDEIKEFIFKGAKSVEKRRVGRPSKKSKGKTS